MEASALAKKDLNPESPKDSVVHPPVKSVRKEVIQMASGVLARFTTAIIMCPADTIKTRLQFQGADPSVRHYNNFGDAFIKIVREEGPLGFTRGLAPRLLYVIPSAGKRSIFFEVY
jgi:hypothetical protein